jgi:hypothetical protein
MAVSSEGIIGAQVTTRRVLPRTPRPAVLPAEATFPARAVVTVEADFPVEEVQAATNRSTSARQAVRPSLMVLIKAVLLAVS